MSENGIAAMLTKLLHIQQKQQKVIGRRRRCWQRRRRFNVAFHAFCHKSFTTSMYPCHPRPSVENSYFAIIETSRKNVMHRKWMEILDFSAEKITMFLLLLPTKRWSVFRPIFFSCQWICTLLRLRLYPSLLKLSSKKAQKLYISASHARVPPSPPPQPLLSPQKLTRLLLLHFAIQSRNLECEVIKEIEREEKLLKRLLLGLLQSSNLIIVHLSWCCKNLSFLKGSEA